MARWPAVFVVALLAAFLGPEAAAHKRLPADGEEIALSFAPLVKRSAPAVVNIYAKRTVRSAPVSPLFNDPFFRRFFGEDLSLDRKSVV